jgi:hypothetical protein
MAFDEAMNIAKATKDNLVSEIRAKFASEMKRLKDSRYELESLLQSEYSMLEYCDKLITVAPDIEVVARAPELED